MKALRNKRVTRTASHAVHMLHTVPMYIHYIPAYMHKESPHHASVGPPLLLSLNMRLAGPTHTHTHDTHLYTVHSNVCTVRLENKPVLHIIVYTRVDILLLT